MMGSNAKPIQLKVFVDKKKKKVMFAEAEEDFVEILFSFLPLPLGTIARLSSRPRHADSQNIKVGSLTSLYQSVVNLNDEHFTNEKCKDALVNPRNSLDFVFQKLKVNLNDTKPISASVGCSDVDPVFLKNKASFIITDDLNVLPVLRNTSIILLNSLGLGNIDLLEKRTMCFGLEEKSKKRVLCAEVGNFFMELLFSFLTIPLGAVIRLTMDNSSPLGITNLYNSISRLGDDGTYLNSEDVKTMLLCPKLANNYYRVTDLLPIYDLDTMPGHFLKEEATFIVSDDLQVTVSPSISTISNFNTLGIPIGDIAVVEASVGEQEALLLLKASLTSASALTDCFNAFMKNPTSI